MSSLCAHNNNRPLLLLSPPILQVLATTLGSKATGLKGLHGKTRGLILNMQHQQCQLLALSIVSRHVLFLDVASGAGLRDSLFFSVLPSSKFFHRHNIAPLLGC